MIKSWVYSGMRTTKNDNRTPCHTNCNCNSNNNSEIVAVVLAVVVVVVVDESSSPSSPSSSVSQSTAAAAAAESQATIALTWQAQQPSSSTHPRKHKRLHLKDEGGNAGVVSNVKYRLPFWNHPPTHLGTAHSTSSTTHSIATHSFVCRVVEEDGVAMAVAALDDVVVFILLPALCVVLKFWGRIYIRPAKIHRYLIWASSFSLHINFRIPISVR
ncbi:hypothetical protein WUBG_01995 [Wuchereria bancrofti]|uniref:Uncharacterized protein n=1 Tax=Wuchereria bancrofti TaxID=6293 RepID=J9EWX0_WUCBA|nr:hypothetical protein WUBG_01995 [Wuchereria bancrofti]